jgi:hypothetical protein
LLVVVQPVYRRRSEEQIIGEPAIQILVRYREPLDASAVITQLREDPEVAKLVQKAKGNQWLEANDKFADIVLPYEADSAPPAQLASAITSFVTAVSRCAYPIPEGWCDGGTCKWQPGQLTHLTFIDGFPYFLCDDCLKALPQLGARRQETYQQTSPNLWRGFFAGFLFAAICAVVWAVLLTLLQQVRFEKVGFILVLAFYPAIIRVMDRVGTKLTVKSAFLAAAFAIGGILFGIGLFVACSLAWSTQTIPTTPLIQEAWNRLREDSLLIRIGLILIVLSVIPSMLELLFTRRQQLRKAFNPDIEIIDHGQMNLSLK